MISEPLFRECDRVHCAVKTGGIRAGDALNISAVQHITPRWSTGISVYTANARMHISAPDITESKRILPYFVWREDWI